jgi:endonuclease/exonuclease/phosphatase family metal-dependent hydrolase
LIRVGTLNLRNTSDRWNERYPLLIDQLTALRPDVIGLQELRRPSLQRRRILDGVNAARGFGERRFTLSPAWKTGWRGWWEGIAVLSQLPVERHDWIDLGHERVAQRVRMQLAGGHCLDFFNTHLHHSATGDAVRLAQLERILGWMQREPDVPQVLVGDFNARPDDPAIVAAKRRLRSAYEVRHGREPESTVPAPVHGLFGEEDPSVIDFIFVNDQVEVHDALVTFDAVHPDDDHLSASDHFGLAATISIGGR